MSGLPRGWFEDEASTICELVQSGGTPKEGFIDKPGVPFLKVYNIVDQKIDFEYRPQFIDADIHRSSMAKSQALPGDVLMNIVGPPLGKVAVIPCSFPTWNVNQALTIFRPSEALTSEWLYYFLCGGDSVKSVINETRGSAGQVNISLSQCRAFKLPLPPLAEQKRIVAKLEALNAKSARARTELARIETLVSRYKQAVLSKAFSGELTRSKVRFGEFINSAENGLSKREGDDGEWTNVLRLTDLKQGQFAPEEPRQIKLTNKEIEKYRLSEGELVVIRVNGSANLVGRTFCFKAGDVWAFCDHFIRISLKPTLDPDFAVLFLNCPPIRSIIERKFVSTSGQKTISQKSLENLPAPETSLEEQHEIVRRIESAFAKIDRLAQEAKRALKLVGRLDEAILAKAFRGELVPQDENDEPAERLLARIRAEREAAPQRKRGRGARR
ncbi:restriction endonuclease subunit S [Hoeflea olei]|uniref:Type I restriction modification DNA specificity domain-containing protein n=1 Tax=Hoeflea olei TaxID=1480615 RepID=A0A1C1YU44_9HYPH|nr:restriction endonuclease subunit S [Hoeflea olei]OCW57063.1 hypothetical protein AWJ14_07890 [Hoeflea olei]